MTHYRLVLYRRESNERIMEYEFAKELTKLPYGYIRYLHHLCRAATDNGADLLSNTYFILEKVQ